LHQCGCHRRFGASHRSDHHPLRHSSPGSWSHFLKATDMSCGSLSRTLPWLSPRGWLRRRRRCRSHNPWHRPGASTPIGPTAPAQLARTRWRRAGQKGRTRSQRTWWSRATEAGWVAPAQRQRAAQRLELGQDQVRGRLPRSTAGPIGLSPGTTQRGSTQRTQAAPAPGLSARRQLRRPSARWGPGLNRAAWDAPCVQGTQNGQPGAQAPGCANKDAIAGPPRITGPEGHLAPLPAEQSSGRVLHRS
jgi:hypothetical protein